MSDYPNNRREMLRAGYKLLNSAKCKRCSAPIDWYQTRGGKKIAMNAVSDDRAFTEAHMATCPSREDFQASSAVRELQALRERHNARVVVMITDEQTHVSFRHGVPGEDLRHDLISAGNFLRAEIQKEKEQR